jgi:hypothetical protein
MSPPGLLSQGDTVRIEIEQLGVIEHRVAGTGRPHSRVSGQRRRDVARQGRTLVLKARLRPGCDRLAKCRHGSMSQRRTGCGI